MRSLVDWGPMLRVSCGAFYGRTLGLPEKDIS